MLKSLSIRNIVLIDNLRLGFSPGLGILTGETGAGKSILLDALSLALGGRADAGLVRLGADQGAVTAEFELEPSHPAFTQGQGLGLAFAAGETQIILRRTLTKDGRSRAFINDEPVTVAALKALGASLIEIHGQHDDRGLLNPAGHRALLDAFGRLDDDIAALTEKYRDWNEALARLEVVKADLAVKQAEEDYDRHCYDELKAIAPKVDEEDQLAEARSLMMQGEKAQGQLADILALLEAGEGVEITIRKALRRLERLPVELVNHLKPALNALEAAANGTEEGLGALHKTHEALNFDADALDQTEERLFGLRALARKHKCQVNDLPALQENLKIKLAALEEGDQSLKALEEKVLGKRTRFEKAARLLSRARKKAAKALDAGVGGELGPLKLEKARFRSAIKPLAVENWGPEGAERVEFEISTNPGAPFAPLVKIASGGELARFVLALKVVLARAGSAPCLIFDEVDSSIGGAVADAVGDRLGRLAENTQVLVVTHSPQVAARASTHWRVDKEDREGGTVTTINILDDAARREEIARMLSGANITDKARAAAGSLIARAE